MRAEDGDGTCGEASCAGEGLGGGAHLGEGLLLNAPAGLLDRCRRRLLRPTTTLEGAAAATPAAAPTAAPAPAARGLDHLHGHG